jgi:endonuclease G
MEGEMMKKTLLALMAAVLLLMSPALAADLKPIELRPDYNHTKYAPLPGEQDIVRQFRAYTTCFDGPDDDDGDGQPDLWAIPQWVAYEIKRYPGPLPKGPKRPRPWITDGDLHGQKIAPKDDSYHFAKKWREANPNSPQLGYDRGHMCMKQHAWRLGAEADWNTHTVLNACPQAADLNQGIWLDLEIKTAAWADKFGSVWIITGPIVFNRKPKKWLGQEGEVPVAIPDAFFKIVIREEGGQVDVLALIYPQRGQGYKRKGQYEHTPYLTSVDVVEALTGLDFMPGGQEELEEITATKVWE